LTQISLEFFKFNSKLLKFLKLTNELEIANFKGNGNCKPKGYKIFKAKELSNPNAIFDMFSRKHNKSAGKIRVNTFHKSRLYEFTDYLRGGLNISMIASIDFTGSNGDPKSSSSLHYLNP
jgi:hypothetical protein